MNITKEQFLEWKAHPVTREIFKEIKLSITNLKDNISNGLTIGDTADITHGLTNRIYGQINGLNQLLNISYEDTTEELED